MFLKYIIALTHLSSKKAPNISGCLISPEIEHSDKTRQNRLGDFLELVRFETFLEKTLFLKACWLNVQHCDALRWIYK